MTWVGGRLSVKGEGVKYHLYPFVFNIFPFRRTLQLWQLCLSQEASRTKAAPCWPVTQGATKHTARRLNKWQEGEPLGSRIDYCGSEVSGATSLKGKQFAPEAEHKGVSSGANRWDDNEKWCVEEKSREINRNKARQCVREDYTVKLVQRDEERKCCWHQKATTQRGCSGAKRKHRGLRATEKTERVYLGGQLMCHRDDLWHDVTAQEGLRYSAAPECSQVVGQPLCSLKPKEENKKIHHGPVQLTQDLHQN